MPVRLGALLLKENMVPSPAVAPARRALVRFPASRLGARPQYGVRQPEHRDALRRMGPAAVHHRSFHGTEAWLFTLRPRG